MTESGKEKKIPYEDFFKQAIVNRRDLSKSRGIHAVYSNFNMAFRKYYGEDPVKIAQKLVSEGKIEIKPVKGGVMIYLLGEGPGYKDDDVDQTIAQILGKPTEQESSMIDQVIGEVAPQGVKKFPEDFVEKNVEQIEYVEVDVPGTPLHLAQGSQTLIVSPRRHFRYEADNPSKAKYLLYVYKIGDTNIMIPRSNQVVFSAVVKYEQYYKDIEESLFDSFLRRSNNEGTAESLTKEALKKLGIKIIEE